MAGMTINELLVALSNANAYTAFQSIARQEPFPSHNNTTMSPKMYYTALTKLKKANLIIKHKGYNKYALTSLGKIVCKSLQVINKSIELEWALNAIDAISLTNREINARDKIVQVLIADEDIRNIIMNMK